jgi:hypothetical protein
VFYFETRHRAARRRGLTVIAESERVADRAEVCPTGRPAMRDRGHHGARPFGQRRAADGPAARPVAEVSPAPRTGVLAWALRSAALAGFVGLIAAQYLVRWSGSVEAPSPRTVLAARGPQDPETTGSIGGSVVGAARGARLDPCAVADGARLRP